MSEYISLIFSGVVAISTVVYAILTWRLTNETLRMRRAQTDPKISIFLRPCRVSMHFLDFVVKNIGYGPAYNINFKILEEFDVGDDRKLSQIDFINKGISYMPPGHEIETYFIRILGQYDKIIDKQLKIEVSYDVLDGRKLSEVISLNMSRFKGIQKLGEDPIYTIAKAIEKIKDDINHFSTGFKKVQVDIYTSQDREKRRNETNR